MKLYIISLLCVFITYEIPSMAMERCRKRFTHKYQQVPQSDATSSASSEEKKVEERTTNPQRIIRKQQNDPAEETGCCVLTSACLIVAGMVYCAAFLAGTRLASSPKSHGIVFKPHTRHPYHSIVTPYCTVDEPRNDTHDITSQTFHIENFEFMNRRNRFGSTFVRNTNSYCKTDLTDDQVLRCADKSLKPLWLFSCLSVAPAGAYQSCIPFNFPCEQEQKKDSKPFEKLKQELTKKSLDRRNKTQILGGINKGKKLSKR